MARLFSYHDWDDILDSALDAALLDNARVFTDSKKQTKNEVMFKEDIVGKRIVIKNVRGHRALKVNKTYKVVDYVNERTVKLLINGNYITWSATLSGDWQIADKPVSYSVEIGRAYIIDSTTNSHKKGEIKIVADFIDGDTRKVILSGTKPGGWIDSKHLIDIIDLSKYRLKTIEEIIYENEDFRYWYHSPKHIAHQEFGKPLVELEASQDLRNIIIRKKTTQREFITDQPAKQNLKVHFISINKASSSGMMYPEDIKKYADRPLTEFYKEWVDTSEGIRNLLAPGQPSREKEKVRFGNLPWIPIQFLTLKQEDVKENNPVTLPF